MQIPIFLSSPSSEPQIDGPLSYTKKNFLLLYSKQAIQIINASLCTPFLWQRFTQTFNNVIYRLKGKI